MINKVIPCSGFIWLLYKKEHHDTADNSHRVNKESAPGV